MSEKMTKDVLEGRVSAEKWCMNFGMVIILLSVVLMVTTSFELKGIKPLKEPEIVVQYNNTQNAISALEKNLMVPEYEDYVMVREVKAMLRMNFFDMDDEKEILPHQQKVQARQQKIKELQDRVGTMCGVFVGGIIIVGFSYFFRKGDQKKLVQLEAEENEANWVPFHFEGNGGWGWIDSPEEWERIKECYKGQSFPLDGAMRFDGASKDYFGFTRECQGKESLLDFAKKHGMKL